MALPDMRNSFFSTILDSVEREATLRGYGMLVANLHLGHQPISRLQEYLLSNRADGLLLLDGSVDALRLRSLSNMPNAIPLVVACEEIPASGFHTVVTDNMRAAERATRHLIELGHRDIGHLLGPEANIIARERLAGFKAMLDQYGLAFRPEWVLKGNFDMESGFAAASRFLAQPQRPTAIFAANDESAIGFLSGLRQHGVRCPDDVSVIGFDDLAVAPHFAPPLTTMRQPREALGRIAASALMDLLDGSSTDISPLRIVLNSELIVRSSTAPPAP
ncbi:substrate-binding domain-containing protein [Devosia sp.]|uniref:substrate-binding domain-containing protein n=1 Tax=Devosia sp. TaxID=1871048 RepID=UPI002622F687|nr:substrate-binding domain-containing protein [Devosia sp.]